MKNIFNFLRKNDIGNPPWEYYFLYNLPKSEYPKYLAKIFKYRTDEKLPLKFNFKTNNWIIDKNRCKTFNQKLQWIKLYGITDLMRDCTDKVKVRDYVREKIGEEYLKPVLQVVRNEELGVRSKENFSLNKTPNLFDKINWKELPNAFVIKCNHGCKWHYIIKDKNEFLNTKPLFELVKRNITGWLEQKYCYFNNFELQYKNIESKIIIEPLMRDEINTPPREIEVYCFNGKPKIFVNVRYSKQREISVYDEKFNQIDLIFHPDGNNVVKKEKLDDLTNQSFVLSEQLSKDFNFVRCDWLVYQDKLYFNELTFTPYSGFIKFDKKWNKKLGSLINI